MRNNRFQATLVAVLAMFMSQMAFAVTQPLSQAVAHLMVVEKKAKQSKHHSPAEISSRVSAAAISLFKTGKVTAPIAVMAVSDLLGEQSPAVGLTITGLIQAGVNPSLMVAAGERAGMRKQEIFVAMLEGGVDPTTVTSSTAAGAKHNESLGQKETTGAAKAVTNGNTSGLSH